MLKATGPGKVEKRTNPPSLLLFNFDIDGDQLKSEHKKFIIAEALPRMRAGATVRVIGLADRLGDPDYNRKLSNRRVARTTEFLKAQVPNGLKIGQETGFGEDLMEREGFADGTKDEKFRSVLLFLTDAPAVARNKKIIISAKSFIATVGSKTGFIPGFTVVPAPPPLSTMPVPRQMLLLAMAKSLDGMMNEDPRSIAMDKAYRLFSECKFEIVFENNKILAAVPTLTTDAGKEGPLQAPPLIATSVSVSPLGESFVTFSWTAKGRPHLVAEPPFQLIKPRTSVFIWHTVTGKIDVSGKEPITTATIVGSRFPSHRLFIQTAISSTITQGELTNLWDADTTDLTKVR